MYVVTLFLKLREGIMFHSRAFLLALVFCFQAGRKKIVESLAVLRAHQLDVVADTDELPIDRHTSSSQSSGKDRQILMSHAKSFLLVFVLSLVVAACGGGGDSGSDSNQADITPPTIPAGLAATAAGGSVVNLTWNASTDNVAVTGYVVKRNGVQIGTPTTPGYSDTGLAPASTYSYTVAAQDAAGNISPDPASVSATTDDTIAPAAPTGLVATAAGGSVVNLAWSASTDNVAVTGYIVRRNGVQVGTSASTTYADTGLSSATTYGYTVAAQDAAGNISSESTIASATTADTIAPTTPAGLVATAARATVVNLTWSASTDNVAVTGYIVKRNGVLVATPTATSYSDTGLADATTYSYTVAARDAAGNVSASSAVVSTTTPDATPPSTPTGVAATAAGATTINLTWTASTDNIGVTGYIVKRNGTLVATPTSTSYADTGLIPATTYSYTVAARDAAGNISSESASASATTTNAADTTPPSTPTGLVATVAGATTINLSWNASTDNIGVTDYIVSRNGVQRGTSSTPSFADTGLTAGTTYIYTVAARDAAGNVSGDSTSASATIPDTTAPSTPTGVTATAAGATTINLAWNASTDNVGVTGYIVKRNGAQVGTPTTTSFADTGLLSGLTQSYTVAARDAAGNVSPESASVEARTADTIAPSTPTGLVASAAGASRINLTWSASTDNVGVTGYIVKRNGAQVATPTATSYSDTGLSSATTYNYTVSAADAANNISPESAIVSATTADATPPSVPAGLIATAAGATTINLTWTASTDNVGVTGYIVKRNGTQVAAPTSTSYADTGLSSATTYSYTVAARDAAGNVSPDSASASATTIDTAAPSIPAGLTATAAGGSVINLMWSASVDDIGVTAYIVKRNGVQVATPTATTYADTGLSSATTYSYTVAARDLAGNISPESASVSVTTADTIPPSTPTGLLATAAGATTINLTWTASTDNVGVTAYIVKRNGVQVATPSATNYADAGLSVATTYSYTVAARDAAGNVSPDSESASATTAGTLFPLHTEAGKRYLVDAAGNPFLMLGESPQAMIGNLTEAEAELFLVNRKSHGFNTVWVNLLCASYTGCKADGTTFDSIAPFTIGNDLSTYDLSAPNEAYFARADRMLQLAAKYGFLVILDPAETGSWLSVLQSNGLAKSRAYGQYLGTRYKNFPNIVWMSGNDFFWTSPSD